MKRWSLVIAIFFWSAAAVSGEHSHGETGTEHKVVAAKKFVPDDVLKGYMESILKAMKELGKAPAANRADLLKKTGNDLEATVNAIFKNCSLDPKADAAIHPILASILEGARLLRFGDERAGHKVIHNALISYEKSFDHKNWSHADSP